MSSPALASADRGRLTELAIAANNAYRASLDAEKKGGANALEHAIEAGRLWKEALDQVEYGETAAWIKKNCHPASKTKVYEAIQFFDHAEDFRRGGKVTTIRDARRAIRPARSPKPVDLSTYMKQLHKLRDVVIALRDVEHTEDVAKALISLAHELSFTMRFRKVVLVSHEENAECRPISAEKRQFETAGSVG